MSHVNEQPMSVLNKAGFIELIGDDNICNNIDEALERAEYIEKNKYSKMKQSKVNKK